MTHPVAIPFATAFFAVVSELSGLTNVSLEVVAPVFVFTGGLVWWLGRKLQNLEDQIKQVKQELDAKSCWPRDSARRRGDDDVT